MHWRERERTRVMSERASAVAAAGAKETASGNGEKDAKERGWVECLCIQR